MALYRPPGRARCRMSPAVRPARLLPTHPQAVPIQQQFSPSHLSLHLDGMFRSAAGCLRSALGVTPRRVAPSQRAFSEESLDRYRPGGYHPVRIGDIFANGRYKVLCKLGYGVYSTVWLAVDSGYVRTYTIPGFATADGVHSHAHGSRAQDKPTCRAEAAHGGLLWRPE